MRHDRRAAPGPAPAGSRPGDPAALVLLVGATGLVLALAAPLWVPAVGWGCPLRALTGWPCPTCGGTRALGALLQGEWRVALRLNPLVATTAVALWAAALWAAAALLGWVAFPRWPAAGRGWSLAAAAAVAANWLYLLSV